MIDAGKFGDAKSALECCTLHRSILSDCTALVSARNHDKLIYYVVGYTARKILKMTSCKECALLLKIEKLTAIDNSEASGFALQFDNGGLLHPPGPLRIIIAILEDSVTAFFSLKRQ